MNDEKIFGELKEIFNWIEFGIKEDEDKVRKELAKEIKGKKKYIHYITPSVLEDFEKANNFFAFKSKREKIAHAMGFLEINLEEEELVALEEIMNDLGYDDFSFEALHNIFLKSRTEKEKEYDDLMKAFRMINDDSNDEYILISKIQSELENNEKKYLGSLKLIISELENSDFLDGDKFYYVGYLKDLYCIQEPGEEHASNLSKSESSNSKSELDDK